MGAAGHFGLHIAVVLRPGEGSGQTQLTGCAAALVHVGRLGNEVGQLLEQDFVDWLGTGDGLLQIGTAAGASGGGYLGLSFGQGRFH